MAAKGILRTVLCKVGFDATESEKQIKAFNKHLKQTERNYKSMEKAGSEMTKLFTTSFLGLTASLVLLANNQLASAESTDQLSESLQNYSDSVSNMNEKLGVLKGEFLEACLPIMTQVVDIFTENIIPVLRKAVGWWDSLSDGTKRFIVTTGLILAVLGPLITIMSKVGSMFNSLIGFLFKAGTAGLFANASLGPLLITLLGIAVALAIILGMSGKFDSMFDSIKTGISDISFDAGGGGATINNSNKTQNNTININSVNSNYDADITAELINNKLGGELG